MESAQGKTRGLSITTRLDPCTVRSVPGRYERAVSNLPNKRRQMEPAGRTIEVALNHRELTVRDPDRESTSSTSHVFDRFYRAADARGKPGPGLAIVHKHRRNPRSSFLRIDTPR